MIGNINSVLPTRILGAANLEMSPESVGVTGLVGTVRTSIRLFTCVNPYVHLLRILATELLVTVFTTEALGARVFQLMGSEVGLLSEALSTYCAYEGFVT